jgi:hypothetical protein
MAVPLRALTIFAHQRRSTLVSVSGLLRVDADDLRTVSETGGGINRLLHLLGAFKISVLHAYPPHPPHPEGRKDPLVMCGLDTIGDRSCEACLRLQAGQDHQGEPVFVASQRPAAAWGRGRSLFRPSQAFTAELSFHPICGGCEQA